VVIAASLCACSFDGSVPWQSSSAADAASSGIDAASSDATVTDWWDDSYTQRSRITITTGPNTPEKGYAGYTAQLSLDTASLVLADKMQADCDDLRVVFWDGSAWHELPHHLLECNTNSSDLRFAVREDIAASTADDRYYLYYANSAASAPAALAPTDVYLWHDDASVDRLADYDTGLIDTWGSTNTWVEKTTWNAAGYYDYLTDNDEVSSFRRPVDERDVYVEVELFHTACYPSNMVTGVIARGIIAGGSGGGETADHYYLAQRGHQAECGGGYGTDGDVFKTERQIVAIDGPDPAAIPRSQWRKQAMATHGINPTQITFWDNDAGWPAMGWPASSELVTGTDADDYEGAGFAGLWIAQDSGRFRGMLIRRYTDPEPAVTVGPEAQVD
jgi:hypothetical protein